MTRHTKEGDEGTDTDSSDQAEKLFADGGETESKETIEPDFQPETEPEDRNPEILHETTPLRWPTIVLAGIVLAVAFGSIVALIRNPEVVGGQDFAELVIYVILILAALLLVRLFIKLLVLSRTKYVIHEEGFRSEYELAYHKKSREIPVEQLRGREHERSRIETITNCATIRLLTGGTDRSLGFLEFEHIPDYDIADENITVVRRRYERRQSDP